MKPEERILLLGISREPFSILFSPERKDIGQCFSQKFSLCFNAFWSVFNIFQLLFSPSILNIDEHLFLEGICVTVFSQMLISYVLVAIRIFTVTRKSQCFSVICKMLLIQPVNAGSVDYLSILINFMPLQQFLSIPSKNIKKTFRNQWNEMG